jgi:putative ABC transport system permease protein
VLVIAEISLAFILLAGAGLLFRAFLGLERAPTGLVADRVLTLRLEMNAAQPQEPAVESDSMASTQGRYLQAIEERVRQIPGVREAGFVTRLHVQSPGNTGTFTIRGRPAPPDARGFPVRLREASPGYFRALGIPLRAGSLFSSRSDAIVVNETLVRAHFPGEDPIGRVLDRGTIVGIVGDVRQSLRLAADPEIYRPLSRTSYSAATLVVSGDIVATGLAAPVRAAIREVNPGQTIFDVRTMDQVIMASHGDVNLSLALIGLFAALALILAAAGVYGVISYAVARRRREFGIRLALGANPRRLRQLVLAQAGVLVMAGVAIGVGGAAVMTRFLRTLLYEVAPTDPLTFFATALLLAGVACLACLNPARRAMRVDPISVLRQDW